MANRLLGLVTLVSSTFLLMMAATRLTLWMMTPPEAALAFPLLLKAAATGLVFDLATLAYALLPAAVYLLLVPRRLTTSHYHNWLLRLCFSCSPAYCSLTPAPSTSSLTSLVPASTSLPSTT